MIFGKQDLTYDIEAAWTFHGLGLIWVLAEVISKVLDYLQTTSQFLNKKGFHKQLSKFLIRKYN